MQRHTWHVWREDDEEREHPLFSGSHTKALSYYRRNGGASAGLVLGYWID